MDISVTVPSGSLTRMEVVSSALVPSAGGGDTTVRSRGRVPVGCGSSPASPFPPRNSRGSRNKRASSPSPTAAARLMPFSSLPRTALTFRFSLCR